MWRIPVIVLLLPAALAAPPEPGFRGDRDRHHWTRARIRPELYSASMTMPMIRIRIAAAVSYS